MILKKKKNHLYLKLERNEPESFGNNSQGLFFSSDLIVDLLAYEVIEPSFMSLLKQINKGREFASIFYIFGKIEKHRMFRFFLIKQF